MLHVVFLPLCQLWVLSSRLITVQTTKTSSLLAAMSEDACVCADGFSLCVSPQKGQTPSLFWRAPTQSTRPWTTAGPRPSSAKCAATWSRSFSGSSAWSLMRKAATTPPLRWGPPLRGAAHGGGVVEARRLLPQQAAHYPRQGGGLWHVHLLRRQHHGLQLPQRLPHRAARWGSVDVCSQGVTDMQSNQSAACTRICVHLMWWFIFRST